MVDFNMGRCRITVRGDGVELRGYFDMDLEHHGRLRDFAKAMEPFGLVIASPYPTPESDPFDGQPTPEKSREIINSLFEDAETEDDVREALTRMHFVQSMVIRGERDQRESAERELRDRELHHFETEQKLAEHEGEPGFPADYAPKDL